MSTSAKLPGVSAKILLETLREADGGRVECTVATPEGPVKGVIAESFFAEFIGTQEAAAQPLTAQRRQRIVADNLGYLETQAAYLLRIMGPNGVVIR